MAVGVAPGFLFDVGLKGLGQINAGLIGEGGEDPQDVGHLIGEVGFAIRFLFTLVAVPARHDAGEFAHFFSEDGHVGQFTEIADANGRDPFVHLGLDRLKGGGSVHALFFVSIQMVTGPSLTSATFMSAPNSPVAAGVVVSALNAWIKAS